LAWLNDAMYDTSIGTALAAVAVGCALGMTGLTVFDVLPVDVLPAGVLAELLVVEVGVDGEPPPPPPQPTKVLRKAARNAQAMLFFMIAIFIAGRRG
jgi:hypothetical protein